MQANNIRHAQVAIGATSDLPGTQTTTIYISRAYTWSQPGAYVTRLTDKFLLASVSKTFSIQAINMILQGVGLAQGKTKPASDASVFDLLGYAGKTPLDSNILKITIDNCVNMFSGIEDKAPGTYDPTYHAGDVAEWARTFYNRPTLTAPTMSDMIDYKFYMCRLDHDVGTTYGYANINSVFLAHLVEVLSGIPYMDYLTQHVLPQLTIANDVVHWATSASAHVNDSILQETFNVGLSAVDPSSSAMVPAVYGGDNCSKECTMGSASLACSATTLVKFIGRCATRGIGGRAAGNSRSGSMDGASTLIYSSSQKPLDLAIVLNTRDFGPGVNVDDFYNQVQALVDTTIVQI